MTEVLRLRPHHAAVLYDYLDKAQPEATAILVQLGYDPETIRVVLETISKVRNPEQLIEILSVGDIANDLICQQCTIQRQLSHCDEPLKPGSLSNDMWESKKLGIKSGTIVTSREIQRRIFE